MLVNFSLNLASKEHVGEIMQKQSSDIYGLTEARNTILIWCYAII